LERWRFLDLSWYSHTSVIETQRHPSFSALKVFRQKTRSAFAGESGFYTQKIFWLVESIMFGRPEVEAFSVAGAAQRRV
jgi:hypothetical protein